MLLGLPAAWAADGASSPPVHKPAYVLPPGVTEAMLAPPPMPRFMLAQPERLPESKSTPTTGVRNEAKKAKPPAKANVVPKP